MILPCFLQFLSPLQVDNPSKASETTKVQGIMDVEHEAQGDAKAVAETSELEAILPVIDGDSDGTGTSAATSGNNMPSSNQTNHDGDTLMTDATQSCRDNEFSPSPQTASSSPLDESSAHDDGLPEYLTATIVAHLRKVSSAAEWQGLVTAFIKFEKACPPSGVRFSFFFFIHEYTY